MIIIFIIWIVMKKFIKNSIIILLKYLKFVFILMIITILKQLEIEKWIMIKRICLL